MKLAKTKSSVMSPKHDDHRGQGHMHVNRFQTLVELHNDMENVKDDRVQIEETKLILDSMKKSMLTKITGKKSHTFVNTPRKQESTSPNNKKNVQGIIDNDSILLKVREMF